jgi:Phytochelatin synthase
MQTSQCVLHCRSVSCLCMALIVGNYSQSDDAHFGSCSVCYYVYHDEQLGQTGGGHFSPIGAYNSEHDKVCIVHTTAVVHVCCSALLLSITMILHEVQLFIDVAYS